MSEFPHQEHPSDQFPGGPDEPTTSSPESVTEFWEDRYAGPEHVWSALPNHTFVQVVASLTPGRSLDLGCGEGADAIWLATQGWQATGYDISQTAIGRAQQAAAEKNVADTTHFEAVNLDEWSQAPLPDDQGRGQYNLITASFLQSPVTLDRIRILQRAARLLVRGGHLLMVTHAAPPSWAPPEMASQGDFPKPEEDLKALDPDPRFFEVKLAETRRRPATDPTGKPATMNDAVILIQRIR
ncbi:class I SAM-dependent methyltransferase [Propionibacterium freudenreichii]|uniref:class I SAM-dependent methyltransferase n=1 Tax=Propionibacterium freudenreichii TaxID=1744 RepID=UPI00254F394B|nr:class I SAM-dependent methyltransferase [Propionibacterium freudenreichii]MDK9626448.1 class I SAM-dependent methyltransferase [Propionibacterium freudenreichii]